MIKTGQSKGQSVLMKYSESIEEIQLLGHFEGSFSFLFCCNNG